MQGNNVKIKAMNINFNGRAHISVSSRNRAETSFGNLGPWHFKRLTRSNLAKIQQLFNESNACTML